MRKIRYVDGFAIRNTLDPNFDVVNHRTTNIDLPYPKFYIPEAEYWIDYPLKDETVFLLKIEDYYDNPNINEKIKKHRSIRNYIDLQRSYIKELCLKGPVPNFILKTEEKNGVKIRYVNGMIVRQYLDPEFVFGGHGYVYSYIPKDEVWVDIKMDLKEIKYVIIHEVLERKLMKEGKTYDAAHDYAIATEKEQRVNDGFGMYSDYANYKWRGLADSEIIEKFFIKKNTDKDTRVTHFEQSKAFCGPASLKILLSHFGKEFTEDELANLCNATIEFGTEHEDLRKALKSIGAKVFEKEKGTIGDLEDFVHIKKVPIIVGWFEKDGDHYSVVVDVTDKEVVLDDPALSGENSLRKIEKDFFQKIWFDFVGRKNDRVSWGWMMAITSF